MADLPRADTQPTPVNNSNSPSISLESGHVWALPNTSGDGLSRGSSECLTDEDELDTAKTDSNAPASNIYDGSFSNATELKPLPNKDGMNCLRRAAREGNITTVESILATETSIDIEAKTKKGRTALIISARYGHLNCFKTLLNHDADLNTRSVNGAASLQWAAYHGQANVVEYLLALHVEIDHTDKFGRSALYLAAQSGHTRVVNFLLESGANLHITTTQPKGMTALHVAAGGGHTDVIRRLIDYGANLSITTALGDTALDIALMGRQKGVVQILLNSEESIALQFAMADGHSKIEEIIKSHCPRTKESNSSHDYEWISQIIEEGGQLLKRPVFRRLLQYAVERKRLEMLKSLIDLNCDVNMLLEPASSSPNDVIKRVRSTKVELLVELDVKLDVNNDDFHKRRRTALEEAVNNMNDQEKIAKMLIEAGALPREVLWKASRGTSSSNMGPSETHELSRLLATCGGWKRRGRGRGGND